MKYIAVYNKDETDYITRRLGFLQNAKDVCISQAINGGYEINFTLPKGDPKWGLVEVGRKVGYDGKVFRIKTIDGTSIRAVSLLQDTCRTHIQYIGDMIDKPAYEIFEAIFKNSPYVTALTKSELEALGLEPVDDKIDFFEMSKKTPMGCLNILMETLKKYRIHSEIYVDNERIGLVRRLGKDRGVVIDPRYNGCQITPTIDVSTLVTKLYPYGKDDLPLDQSYRMLADGTLEPLGETNDGKGYILSPNYDILGEYEAFSNFDEITKQDDLLSAAQLQFDSKNIERIDIPKYAVDIKLIEIQKEVKLGDTVTVNDIDNGVKSKQRVIAVKNYPYEPHRNTITVGVPPVTAQEAFNGSFMASQYLRLIEDEKQRFKTPALEFMKKNTDVTVENYGEFQKIAQYETGAMFVSPNGKYAVAIIDGKVKVGERPTAEDRKTQDYPDGWKWTGVFGQGKVTVNEVFTGTLYTNLCTVMSQNGKLEIKDNLIQMFDGAGTLRFNAGYSESLGKYVFELYNADGKQTAYIDDDGNLTICGIFKTGFDGEARIEIDKNGINSYNVSNQLDGLVMNPDGFWSSLSLYATDKKCFTVEVEKAGGGWYLMCKDKTVMSAGTNHCNLMGTWNYGGSEIATQSDIDNLQAQINALKQTNTNPII